MRYSLKVIHWRHCVSNIRKNLSYIYFEVEDFHELPYIRTYFKSRKVYIVRTGLDIINKRWPKKLNGSRVGLVVHPASVDSKFNHAVDCFAGSARFMLKALFGPQHGIRGETQDNMIEWEGFKDKKTGLPVYSLYGKTRKPLAGMLQNIDVMVVDMQDVGARYYTFIWTMDLCMQACHESVKSVVILDRPNPLGGNLSEGPVLDPAFASFVGLRPLPVRHGMTIAEIARYLRDVFYPSLDLHIIPMKEWERKMWFDKTRLPWFMPSPNMPTLDTAVVYPGMCLLEGTELSEGRGTTRPFELFGAPYIDPDLVVKDLMLLKLPGVVFRPVYFQPTFHKFADQLCGGAQIHVINRKKYKSFKTGVAVIKTIHDRYNNTFEWKNPPYEYEETKMPVDILAGSDRLRIEIEDGRSVNHMENWWKEECLAFNRKIRMNYLMYK
ncbi:MAG: DUF1343 domain-containing protein [Nitrospiraceae bacterium]|nr:MAG: DUF1343 domain-containing protein [Nitrospiraceae bacterium]